jgi:actin-like ATPase involved in cell morphogenesis
MIGIDFGTSNLVVARTDENDKTKLSVERNCFFRIGTDFEDMLIDGKYNYIKDKENGEEWIYICGRDALKIANLFAKNDSSGNRVSHLRRPMKNMVIASSSDKKAIQMLKYMIQSLVGKSQYEGEVAVISVPSNPLSGEFNNIFHSNMCQGFIRELGYNVFPINEALSVIYATAPKTKDEDGNDISMTGIGISWGAGGVNGCLAYKGVESIKFSHAQSGDWIDEQVSTVCEATSSEVTVMKEKLSKEKKLDLINPDYGNEIIAALSIYYRSLIENVIRQFKNEFIKKAIMFTDPIEVVVSGGTSKPKGFDKLVKQIIDETDWPFEISGVRRAKDPLSSTALGCLAAAKSKEKKLKIKKK